MPDTAQGGKDEMSTSSATSTGNVGLSKPLNFPTEHSEEVRTAAAKKLWPEVLQWLKGAGDNYAEEAEDEFLKIMCRSLDTDGYQLAKDFDDWHPDAELVEILDGFDSDVYCACREARENWVEVTGWAPAFSAGDVVEFRSGFEWVLGKITEVRATEGLYIISKNLSAVPRTGGFIIAHTDVRRAP